jgi:small acid-soluble spore protein D (minor alpha/beta-type SASP)
MDAYELFAFHKNSTDANNNRGVINMSSSRKSKLLNPQAYDAMTRFKMECAEAIGYTQFVKENNDHYKGDVSAVQNGSEGGPIGGEMVKRMVRQSEDQIK